jgi:8-oxo-dGTP diphosphatase
MTTRAGRGRAATGRAHPTFPCPRCGRPLARAGARPPKIRCPRCRFLIFDYPRTCAGTLVLRDETVLLLRRAHTPKRGFVDVPGGFLEAGETFEGAARRELREETGLTLGRLHPLGVYWDRYDLPGFGPFPTINHYFVGRWRAGTPRPGDDAASAEWVPIATLGRSGARYAWAHMRMVFADLRRWVRGEPVPGAVAGP